MLMRKLLASFVGWTFLHGICSANSSDRIQGFHNGALKSCLAQSSCRPTKNSVYKFNYETTFSVIPPDHFCVSCLTWVGTFYKFIQPIELLSLLSCTVLSNLLCLCCKLLSDIIPANTIVWLLQGSMVMPSDLSIGPMTISWPNDQASSRNRTRQNKTAEESKQHAHNWKTGKIDIVVDRGMKLGADHYYFHHSSSLFS